MLFEKSIPSNIEGSVFRMKFTFTEKRMDSSEELRAYAMRKVGKLDRFFKTEAEAFITCRLYSASSRSQRSPFETTACFTGQANLQTICMPLWILVLQQSSGRSAETRPVSRRGFARGHWSVTTCRHLYRWKRTPMRSSG